MLVARTDPDAPKHQGLTYFVVDMHAPGVEVRPLRQITGEAEFNEVYFTDVRIPDAERLGDVGEGWRGVADHADERAGRHRRRRRAPQGLRARSARRSSLWEERADHDDPTLRDRLMRLWVEAEVNRLTNIRAQPDAARWARPAPRARRPSWPSPSSTSASTSSPRPDRSGGDALRDLRDDPARPDGLGADSVQKAFLRARANSIEGGTSEIMRNILGERVLGLPATSGSTRTSPGAQVPRS